MSLDTKRHLEAMIETSLALEDQLRKAGAYSKDCNRVHDAIARGQKSGVALLWDAAGRMEIVDLNGGREHVSVRETDENGLVVEHDFSTIKIEGPRSEQHRDTTRKMVEETSAKPYAPVEKEKRESAADAAKLARQKAIQDRNASTAKREYQAGIERTTLIAQRMKEAAAKIHK
jgi:hypothetical protein